MTQNGNPDVAELLEICVEIGVHVELVKDFVSEHSDQWIAWIKVVEDLASGDLVEPGVCHLELSHRALKLRLKIFTCIFTLIRPDRSTSCRGFSNRAR